jgi:hypothetical protein
VDILMVMVAYQFIIQKKIRSRKGGYTGNYYHRTTFSILSTFKFLSSLKDILKQNGINYSIVSSKKDRCVNNFTLSISGNLQIEKALDWLYKDSSVFLERKYN